MDYPNDLIAHADRLHQAATTTQDQADLRRAISAAYYALFHELTSCAAKNWGHERHRYRFARLFQHAKMNQACKSWHRANEKTSTQPHHLLLGIAEIFTELQESRHAADYDLSKTWAASEVGEIIFSASTAVLAWRAIEHEPSAQDFLFELLGSRG